MSLEGRMAMPVSATKTINTLSIAEKQSFFEKIAHSSGEEFEKTQAVKLLNGYTTPQELVQKFGPKVMDIIMKRAQKMDTDEVELSTEVSHTPPQTIYPKIPHPLYGIIPRVLEHYKQDNRTEDDEQEYLDLLNDLKKNNQFRNILEQYQELIALYPDRTEVYEMKAMNDFVELNDRIAKPE